MIHETGQETMLSRLEPGRRIVVKVGSALLVEGGRLRRRWLSAFACDVAALASNGCRPLIVSSGSVGLGRAGLGPMKDRLAERQAAAAIGQIRLAEAWRRALGRERLVAAQILLSPRDTEERRRHLNARATIEALLAHGAVPVINENDTVATEELKFGDNDRLAARVAQLVSAELVVLLSDVDGLYDRDPRAHAGARHIPRVERITPEIAAMAGPPEGGMGSGGMVSKLEAAKIAMAAGAHLAITDGRNPGSLGAFFDGARASWFIPATEPIRARKSWIAATLRPKGALVVDEGAAAALRQGRSLLAVGLRRAEGEFARGDPVRLVSESGESLGTGLVNYESREVCTIVGAHSSRFEALLGYRGPDALVHRDNLALSVSKSEEGETA